MAAGATKYSRRLALVCLAALLSTFCASIDRQVSRHSIYVGGAHEEIGDYTYQGCGEDVLRERQRVNGATVEYNYERWNGITANAKAVFLEGILRRHSGFDPEKSSYWLGGVHSSAGYQAKYWSIDFGLGLVVVDSSGPVGLGSHQLRLGNMNSFWYEHGITIDPVDGRLLFLGIGGRGEHFRASAGVASQGYLLYSFAQDAATIASGSEVEYSTVGYAKLDVILSGGLGLRASTIVGEDDYSVQFGVGWNFDVPKEPAAKARDERDTRQLETTPPGPRRLAVFPIRCVPDTLDNQLAADASAYFASLVGSLGQFAVIRPAVPPSDACAALASCLADEATRQSASLAILVVVTKQDDGSCRTEATTINAIAAEALFSVTAISSCDATGLHAALRKLVKEFAQTWRILPRSVLPP